MRGPLPEFVDPFRLARERARLEGRLAVSEMERLRPLLHGGAGAVEVELRFRTSGAGAPRIEGSASLLASLVCQRCLEPFDAPLRCELRLSFTGADEALAKAELAAGYEPLEAGGPIGLAALVEDEMLLALPDFPMHPPQGCATAAPAGAGAAEGASPFSALRALAAARSAPEDT